jgi:hypothetical protein
MIELALGLIDRVIDLIRHGQERDRQLHEDFFVSFSEDLEQLHANYVEAFARYRASLATAAGPFNGDHPIIKEIQRDIVFTEQLRARVRTLFDYRQDPVFGKLAMAAQFYLAEGATSARKLVEGVDTRHMNARRGEVIDGLHQIFLKQAPEAEIRAEAIALVDDIVVDLQNGYARFVKGAAETKKRLLDKR